MAKQARASRLIRGPGARFDWILQSMEKNAKKNANEKQIPTASFLTRCNFIQLDNLHGGELAAPHHLVDKISGQDLDYLTCGSTDSLAEIQSVNHSLILVMADQLLSNGRIVSRRV